MQPKPSPFALTLFDYSKDHQWPRLLGWSEAQLKSVPIHYDATSADDYLNLANFGGTALGVSAESGGGTSAGTRALQNVYVYRHETPRDLYEKLSSLLAQGGPSPLPPT